MAQRFVSNESPSLYGIFGMKVYELKQGNLVLVRRIVKKNQITNQGRTALLDLMFPGSTSEIQTQRKIWSISAGTNSTPPTINDVPDTMDPVWTGVFVDDECQIVAEDPNIFLLRIQKQLPADEANGYTLVEAGIFTRGDNDDPGDLNNEATRWLYARQIHPQISKTSSVVIEYFWELGISIQGA